jgi:hypothetical protein
MTNPKPRQWHPYAKLFPVLDDDELQALADDIIANGLQNPILVDSQDRIIDGRNRSAACLIAGIEPRTVIFQGDEQQLLKKVISLNLRRRHLTDSQRAMIAAEIARMPCGGDIKKMKSSPSIEGAVPMATTAEAAKLLNVSETSVDRAKRVNRNGISELKQAVTNGEVTVAKANEIARLPADIQAAALTEAKENPPRNMPRKGNSESAASHKPPDDSSESAISNSGITTPQMGIQRAHEAIACLKKISVNDEFRSRAFQMVRDWIKQNP